MVIVLPFTDWMFLVFAVLVLEVGRGGGLSLQTWLVVLGLQTPCEGRSSLTLEGRLEYERGCRDRKSLQTDSCWGLIVNRFDSLSSERLKGQRLQKMRM